MKKILTPLVVVLVLAMQVYSFFSIQEMKKEIGYLYEEQMVISYQVKNWTTEVANSLLRDVKNIKSDISIMTSVVDLARYIKRMETDQQIKKEIDKLRERARDYKMLKSSIWITNNTAKAIGTGVTIKINNNFYVLSAAHLVNNITDELFLCEDGIQICSLTVKKIDKENDLLLLEAPEGVEPKLFSQLAEREPIKGEKIIVVGNPAGVEDVITEGRVIDYNKSDMWMQVGCFFGNSGGGVFNQEGKLVGIMSRIAPSNNNIDGTSVSKLTPIYTFAIAIRLETIQEFLKDLNPTNYKIL